MARLKKRADGRYCKQVYIGTVDGKKKYKQIMGGTIAEVEKAAAELKLAIGKGLDPSQMDTTLGTLCNHFIGLKHAQGVGVSWAQSLRIYLNYFLDLFDLPVSKIKTSQLQEVLNGLAVYSGGQKPLGHKTLMEARRAIRCVFDLAIPEIIQYNPAARLVLPAGAPAVKREPITDAQRQWIIDTPHRAQTAAMIMLYAGLRRGEVCALTWADINLRDATIRVNKALDFKGGREKCTKTQAGDRVVHMPAILVDYLAAQPHNTLYVVQTARGGRMTDTAWRRMWASYMSDLNVKYGYAGLGKKNKPGGLELKIQEFTAHQLRHTFASMLYMAGVDVLIARDQLGHTDIKTTLAIYTHLDKLYKRNGMGQLNQYLGYNAGTMQHG
ncbi:MAG: site-specific integrase [Pygmaiobacter sp.]|nr:site-specific integrase [Pygmaiobacter sp.]